MLKLFDNPASPFCRKVLVLLRETGQLDDVELTFAIGHPTDPGSMPIAENPVGKIPTLLREGGPAIYDSRVICRYLNHVAGGSLYGSGDAEFPIIAREAIAEGMLDSGLLIIYEGRLRPAEMQFQPWIDGQTRKILEACTRLNGRIDEYAGDMTIDKIALAAALGYLDFRMPDLGWRDGRDGLAEWFAGFAARDSFTQTMPVG